MQDLEVISKSKAPVSGIIPVTLSPLCMHFGHVPCARWLRRRCPFFKRRRRAVTARLVFSVTSRVTRPA
jgi:hypothetical protein